VVRRLANSDPIVQDLLAIPMPEDQQASPPPHAGEPLWARTKKTLLAVLFSLILLIPRIRRLRRRVRTWAAVRSVAAVVGAVLVWRFARHATGTESLLLGIVLIAFGVLVTARPQTKSLDDTTRELGALVALNGGSLLDTNGASPMRDVTIFVHPERLLVLTSAQAFVMEIPIAWVRQVQVERVSLGSRSNKEIWELAIACDRESSRTVRFHYEGTFSEHLARIAQETVMGVWKRSLPVVRS
jgi:hypothetical protein